MAKDREFEHTDCQKYAPLWEDYVDGQLDGADVTSALQHSHGCADCRAALEAATMSVRVLRVAEPSVDPGPSFARRVMARIRSVENERVAARANFWQPFVFLGWRFAATATLALVALVSYNAGWRHRTQPSVVAVRPTVDIFAPEPARVPVSRGDVLMMVADNGHEKP
jgi:anti-sigma-K factor RskA